MRSSVFEELKKLSSIPWIQERWNPAFGDIVVKKEDEDYVFHHIIEISCSGKMIKLRFSPSIHRKEDYIWIPVGIHLLSGNYQVDDLVSRVMQESYEINEYYGVGKGCLTTDTKESPLEKMKYLHHLLLYRRELPSSESVKHPPKNHVYHSCIRNDSPAKKRKGKLDENN